MLRSYQEPTLPHGRNKIGGSRSCVSGLRGYISLSVYVINSTICCSPQHCTSGVQRKTSLIGLCANASRIQQFFMHLESLASRSFTDRDTNLDSLVCTNAVVSIVAVNAGPPHRETNTRTPSEWQLHSQTRVPLPRREKLHIPTN